MAAHRPDRQTRRRIAQMEAKRKLRRDQASRRRRDNILAAVALAAVLGLAVSLQAVLFSSNPTAEQMELLQTPLPVPENSPIPDPSLAQGRVFKGSLVTNQGTLDLELDGRVAPQAVAVFKTLADEGYFAGKACHRLTTLPTMAVLQCGSADGRGGGDPAFQWGPVENAPANGRYPAGTVAVARGAEQDTHGRQFFIVYKDTTLPGDTGGYTVMGKVTSGLAVVRKIAAEGLRDAEGPGDGAPKMPVTIDSLSLK